MSDDDDDMMDTKAKERRRRKAEKERVQLPPIATSGHMHFSFILAHLSHAMRRGFPVASRVHSVPTWAQRTHALAMTISGCQPAID